MQEKDTASKLFFGKKEIVADLFNLHLFNGEQRLMPENLDELNIELPKLIKDEVGQLKSDKRIRDILFTAKFFTDGRTDYLVLGMELQSTICKNMIVRLMEYDVRQYSKQYEQDNTKINPIMNIVVNLSNKPWKGPTRLFHLFPPMDESLLKFINDYCIHVIEIKELYEKRDLLGCEELRAMVNFLMYRDDLNKLTEEIEDRSGKTVLSNEAVDMLNVFLGCDIQQTNPEEEMTMSKAIAELKQRERAIGIEQGIEQGMEQGMEAKEQSIIKKMLQCNLPMEDIIAFTGANQELVKKIASQNG